ncbi:hypothetical protein [Gymnodinialimonas hymeniacidonis]|uniref:hypothetical protein n=1 Tax=Gymnodinialimonas hymeniacidonis TaxID=3126508 RepID=UPI0034C69E60
MREFWRIFHASLGSLSAVMGSQLRERQLGSTGDRATDPNRINLFAGSFPSEAEMFAYCFTPVTEHGPEQINLDLPEASIDTFQVDAVMYDQVIPRLSEYFGPKIRRRILRKLKPGEALILIPTAAFSGSEYRIHSTPKLRHLGYETSHAAAMQSQFGAESSL